MDTKLSEKYLATLKTIAVIESCETITHCNNTYNYLDLYLNNFKDVCMYVELSNMLDLMVKIINLRTDLKLIS